MDPVTRGPESGIATAMGMVREILGSAQAREAYGFVVGDVNPIEAMRDDGVTGYSPGAADG